MESILFSSFKCLNAIWLALSEFFSVKYFRWYAILAISRSSQPWRYSSLCFALSAYRFLPSSWRSSSSRKPLEMPLFIVLIWSLCPKYSGNSLNFRVSNDYIMHLYPHSMVKKRSFYRNTKTCLIPRISHFEWIWFSMFPFSETFSHAADVTLLFNTKEIINSHYPACIHNANFSVTWWSGLANVM